MKTTPLTPPHDAECEAQVLATLLSLNARYDEVTLEVSAEDFYIRKHQIVYQTISELIESQGSADILTVGDRLRSNGKLEEVGGFSFLAELTERFISGAYVLQHAKIIKSKSQLRKLILATQSILTACYNQADDTVSELLAQAESTIVDAVQGKTGNTAVSVAQEIFEIIKDFDIKGNPGELTGIPSGLVDLDRETNGFQGGDLIIIAARPGVGKTALAVNIAEHCGKKNVPLLFFSLEMSRKQVIHRIISSMARIPGSEIRNRNFQDRSFARLSVAAGQMEQFQMWIDDRSGQTLTELRAKARTLKREHHIGIIIIDYLQLMQSGERIENRNLEIAQITRGLKILARDLNIPIILLSQLNRQVENRGDKRPGLADLRDSGQIEADADLILFLYREHLYAPSQDNERSAELIIGKHRNGGLGTINLVWNPEITQFANGLPRSERQKEQWEEM